MASAVAVAVNPQDKPWWATDEIDEEIASYIEFQMSLARAGIEGYCVPKARAIEARFDDRGSKVKRTSITPVLKLAPSPPRPRLPIPKAIKHRSWSKFGEAMEDDASSQVTTISSEEVLLERPRTLGGKVDEPATFGDPLAMLASKGDAFLMVCRTCGQKGDHWTFRCHLNNIGAKTKSCTPFYWPPRCEVCMEPVFDDVMEHWFEGGQGATIRVMNLSKDICERDLFNLLYRFGLLVHVSLAVDKDSESGRQFGIIQFGQREEAEEAISCLDGYKYKGLTLGAEWAIPMPKGADGSPMCPSCMQATENCVRVTNLYEDTGLNNLQPLPSLIWGYFQGG
ncbi:unnamed protein product [Urochloa humidicola]